MASPRTERPAFGGVVPRFSWGSSLAVLAVLGLTGYSVAGTNFNIVELLRGGGAAERFVSEMFPPDLSAATLRAMGTGILETFQMSFLGALLGAAVAFPLSALGTREIATVGASRGERLLLAVPYHLSRMLLNVFRSVPDILWALVFVVALGLGPFPGTLALAVHSAGVLGKLYSETLEAVPSRPVQALTATGASGFQAFLFGRLPQAMNGFLAHALPVGMQHPLGDHPGLRRRRGHRAADPDLHEPLRLPEGRDARRGDDSGGAARGPLLGRGPAQACVLAPGLRQKAGRRSTPRSFAS